MEYTQWGQCRLTAKLEGRSLNPCCNGIYSMRPVYYFWSQ